MWELVAKELALYICFAGNVPVFFSELHDVQADDGFWAYIPFNLSPVVNDSPENLPVAAENEYSLFAVLLSKMAILSSLSNTTLSPSRWAFVILLFAIGSITKLKLLLRSEFSLEYSSLFDSQPVINIAIESINYNCFIISLFLIYLIPDAFCVFSVRICESFFNFYLQNLYLWRYIIFTLFHGNLILVCCYAVNELYIHDDTDRRIYDLCY